MKKYIRLICENFNQCLFLGFVLWALFINPFIRLFPDNRLILYFLAPFLNGLMCFFIVRIGRLFFKRFLKRNRKEALLPFSIEFVGFGCGVISIFASFQTVTLVLGCIITLLTILKINSFMHQISSFLPPHRYITHREMLSFLSFFIDLIIFFSLINLTLGIIDNPVILASEDILNEEKTLLRSDNLFNALYFTVITLTTVGFGDFIPLSYFGKMIVVLECLTSYVMFGLMIGLMARGIKSIKSNRRTAQQNARLKRR